MPKRNKIDNIEIIATVMENGRNNKACWQRQKTEEDRRPKSR